MQKKTFNTKSFQMCGLICDKKHPSDLYKTRISCIDDVMTRYSICPHTTAGHNLKPLHTHARNLSPKQNMPFKSLECSIKSISVNN